MAISKKNKNSINKMGQNTETLLERQFNDIMLSFATAENHESLLDIILDTFQASLCPGPNMNSCTYCKKLLRI